MKMREIIIELRKKLDSLLFKEKKQFLNPQLNETEWNVD